MRFTELNKKTILVQQNEWAFLLTYYLDGKCSDGCYLVMFVTHVINLPLLSPKLIQPVGLGFHAWLYAQISEQPSEHYNSAKIYFSKYYCFKR